MRAFPAAPSLWPATWALPSTRFAVDLGVGLAALANLLFFARVGEATRLVLAAVVVAVAGAPAARRAMALLRRGILDRDALAWVAIVACFTAGIVDLLVARPGFAPPGWLQALGVRPAPGQPARGAGFEAAAVIAVAALASRVAEAALHRLAIRDILARERRRRAAASSPRDLAAALDAEVLASLERLAGAGDAAADPARWAPGDPAPGTWEDAAVRGFFTAALGLATFALVTRGLLGAGLIGPVALLAAAAVLVSVSPSSVLVAAPAARAIAVLRARAAGVLVKDPAALEALAGVDAACLEKDSVIAAGELARLEQPATLEAVRGLRARGVRALVLSGDQPEATALAARRLCVPGAGGLGPAERALAIRDLQFAGARVLLVSDGRGVPAGAAQADVTLAVTPGALPGSVAAPIVITEGQLGDLPWLVDLGRALRAVIRQSTALGVVFNAVLIPAAALGYVSPLGAALAMLGETMLGLLNAARLLRWPVIRSAGEGRDARRTLALRRG